MKIEVAKRDLVAALQVVSIGTSGTGSDLSTHFLFRENDGQVDVLAYHGRVGAGIPVVCNVSRDGDDAAFTVESWRLKQWLDAANDAALTLAFNSEDSTVKATSEKGTVDFRSLDPKAFPYWDESLAKATATLSISGARLHAAFSHAKLWINEKKETTAPHLAICEVKDGALQATDQAALSLVTIDEFEKSSLRVHGKDLQQVLAFLSLAGEDPVEVLEGKRSLFLRRVDGGVLSVGRPTVDFPDIKVDKTAEDVHYWTVPTEDVGSAIKQLSASASKEDRRLAFRFDDDSGRVVLSMTSASGADAELQIDVIESGSVDNPKFPLPTEGFAVEYQYLQSLLSQYKGKSLRIGITPMAEKGKMGWIRFRDDRDGDDFLTLLVWLK